MAILSENPVDHEIQRQKTAFDIFKRRITIFMNSYKTLPPKERARTIQEIHAGFKSMTTFFEQIKNEPLVNSGSRFAIENMRQSYSSITALWRKFETQLESSGTASTAKVADAPLEFPPIPPDNVTIAVDQFKEFMKKSGQNLNSSQLDHFRSQISTAFESATKQTGKYNHSISLGLENGRLKVKIQSSD